MLGNLRLVFLIFGFVCFVLAAILANATPPPPRSQQLQAAGLAFWIATLFLV